MRKEKGEKRKEVVGMKVFWSGFLTGALSVGIIAGIIAGFVIVCNRDKEIIEYAEKQQQIEALREDYGNRDPVEFFEVPGVRRSADDAIAEFERRRDEILQRFRTELDY